MSHNEKYLDNEGNRKLFNIIKRIFTRKDGYYEGLGAGTSDSSKQLLSTTFVEDKVPYNFRTSGGSADIGDRENDKIVGGSIVWNQLVNINDIGTTSWGNGTYSITNHKITIVCSATPSTINSSVFSLNIPIISGHKYLALTNNINNSPFLLYSNTVSLAFNTIQNASANGSVNLRCYKADGFAEETTYEFYLQVFDLTQMFGSTIADYLYGLSDNSGVGWFKNLFPKPYYTYNAGSLLSVKLTSHDMVGFNQWDEEMEDGFFSTSDGQKINSASDLRSVNEIPCLPNTTYYCKCPCVSSFIWYDKNHNFIGYKGTVNANSTFTTPNNCYYFNFGIGKSYYGHTTYNHDICINLSWSGYRNGEYEEYEKISYALDNTLELRGIPKLDVNNKLYFDGDVYASDGSVGRRYGIVDLGTLNYVYQVSSSRFNSTSISNLVKKSLNDNIYIANVLCAIYVAGTVNSTAYNDMTIGIDTRGYIYVKNTSYTDATTFATAMSGVYLLYELATPTEEQATPFQNPQKVNDFGTEEYVVPTQLTDVEMPVGHETQYLNHLRDKLQRLPEMPENNSYYIVHYNNRQCEFTSLSTWLTSNGYGDITGFKDAIGGTLRQLLVTNVVAGGGTLDFNNTTYVDLGSLAWNYISSTGHEAMYSTGLQTIAKYPANDGTKANILCSIYVTDTRNYLYNHNSDYSICLSDDGTLYVYSTTMGTSGATFKNAMKGVLLAYEKA